MSQYIYTDMAPELHIKINLSVKYTVKSKKKEKGKEKGIKQQQGVLCSTV